MLDIGMLVGPAAAAKALVDPPSLERIASRRGVALP
jgi:hypothetical protein